MSVATKLEEIQKVLDVAKVDAGKADGGNKAAGTRVRKAMQELKVAAQGVRAAVSELKSSEK